MSGLQSFRLQRFKRIKDAALDLKGVNVLVGGNNILCGNEVIDIGSTIKTTVVRTVEPSVVS